MTRSAKLNRRQIQPPTNISRNQIHVKSTKLIKPCPINLPLIPPASVSHVATQMDVRMAPSSFPIEIPLTLAPYTMPNHLPKFLGFLNQDPSHHIEQYIEIMAMNVIPEDTYRLMWFFTMLKDPIYEWYC